MNFATGYRAVGLDYFGLSELGRASEYFTKAFQLREHASEREKLAITADYYQNVTGELDKAAHTYQEEIESYPRDSRAHLDLGNVYTSQGQYERAAESYRQSLRLAPDNQGPYGDLVNSLISLQRFDETRQIVHEAQARKLDIVLLHSALYALAFLGADSAAMARKATPGAAIWRSDGSTRAIVRPAAIMPRTVCVEGRPPSIVIGGPNPARRKTASDWS